ncbi:MAG: hypothetical protein K5885_09240, partial [Bacteroidales bacterium]|nr:hypothetical protein [Bacteroidales bacterium]
MYHPDEPFSSLIGCPINGVWKIEIVNGYYTDDNGYLFDWEIVFDESLAGGGGGAVDSAAVLTGGDQPSPNYGDSGDNDPMTFVFHAPPVTQDTTIKDTLRLYDPVGGCWYDTTISVLVTAPEIHSLGDSVICLGETITLNAGPCDFSGTQNSAFSQDFSAIDTGGDRWHSHSHATAGGQIYYGPGNTEVDSFPDYVSAMLNFPERTKVFPAGGRVKLGNSEPATGSMTSVPLSLPHPFAVDVRAKGWGAVPGSSESPKRTRVNVVVDKGQPTQQVRTFETDPAYHWPGDSAYRDYSLLFDGASVSSTITVETVNAGSAYDTRAFVSYVGTRSGDSCSYVWGCDTCNWGNDSTNASILVSPTATTTYTVTVTPVGGGCARVDTVRVVVNPKPEVTITVPQDICPNAGTVEITASLTTPTTPNYTYTWNSNDITLSSSTTNTVTATIPAPPASCGGNYGISVIVCDGNGCKDTTSAGVVVRDLEAPEIQVASSNDPNGTCASEITAPTFTYTDNCEGTEPIALPAANVTTEGPSHTGCNYTQTWKANYTDGCGNAANEVTVTYTWTEGEAPTINTSLADHDYACESFTAPTAADFTVSDPCNSSAQLTDFSAGSVTDLEGCQKQQTWTASYTGACGLSATKTVTYTWKISPVPVTLSPTICENATYSLFDTLLTTPGSYTRTGTSICGCDSTVTINLSVSSEYRDTINQHICQGDQYTFNDTARTTTGFYTQKDTAQNGCDSITVLHLFVHEPEITHFESTICLGTLFQEYGFDTLLTTSGTHTLSRTILTQQYQCDSTIIVTLTVRDSVIITATPISICPTENNVIVSAEFQNAADLNTSVTWTANGASETHSDVTSNNPNDTYTLSIPDNLCDDSVHYSITYSDGICSANTTGFVHVVDTIAPVITGTLPTLSASGCSTDDAPAAYSSVAAINALDDVSISDNCTSIGNLNLTYTDATVTDTCQIELLRTYTISDLCGNSSIVTQNILINRPSTFTISGVDTAATVPCIALATSDNITTPNVHDACGNPLEFTNVTTTESISDCEGTRSFTFHYENCAGNDTSWTFTYTIDVQPITAPDNDTDNVTCLADTVNYPIDAPTIVNECNIEATVVSIERTSTVDATNAGDITHTYTYTLCGQTVEWSHTYHVSPESFDSIADSLRNVFCISEIDSPTTPSIVVCNTSITLVYDSTTSTLSNGCGDSVYHYHYVVNGITYPWSYTYRVTPEDFAMPNDSIISVQCITNVIHPEPPVVTNNCNTLIVPVEQPVDSVFDGCSGHVTYSWLYNDCTGSHSHIWSCTYYIDDTVAPTFTAPDNTTLCRSIDGTIDTSTVNTGVPTDLSDNCAPLDNITVTYSDVSTNHLTAQDTIVRTWVVSDLCNDLIYTQYIYVNPILETSLTITVCATALPYTWNGVEFTGEGTQAVTLTASNNCDSVVTMTLHVNDAYQVTDEATVCATALPYTWNGVEFTAEGTQTVTLSASNNCDSVVTMTLHVNDAYQVTDEATVCATALPYTWNGVEFNAEGTQTVTLTASNNCDSVVTMTLHVNDAYQVTDEATVCATALPYTWNGVEFNGEGTQTV